MKTSTVTGELTVEVLIVTTSTVTRELTVDVLCFEDIDCDSRTPGSPRYCVFHDSRIRAETDRVV